MLLCQHHLHALVGHINDFLFLLGVNVKLRAPKGKTVPSVVAQPHPQTITSTESGWDWTPEPNTQPSNPVASFVPESNVEVAEEGLSQEGELLVPLLFALNVLYY